MKFIEAIKAMGPGQLLISPHGGKYEIKDGTVFHVDSFKILTELNGLGLCNWTVEDKPRPRVRFDAAMRAALEGKVIRALRYGHSYKMIPDGFYRLPAYGRDSICTLEMAGDWEIIEPEGDN